MQLVQHHIFQVAEKPFSLFVGKQQRHLLGRGQQNIGRLDLLALTFGLRCVTRARFDGNRQAHFEDWLGEVALDIHRQRLQRRDIKRVHADETGARRHLAAFRQIGERGHEAAQRLAGTCRRNQQHVFTAARPRHQLQLMRARRPPFFSKPFLEWKGQGADMRAGSGRLGVFHAFKVVKKLQKRRAEHCRLTGNHNHG